jgi:hypothetical protein
VDSLEGWGSQQCGRLTDRGSSPNEAGLLVRTARDT